jgi:dipeptidyl-peptidase 4
MKKNTILLLFLFSSLHLFGLVSTDMHGLMKPAPIFSFMHDGSYVYVSENKQTIVQRDAKSAVETILFSVEGRSQLASIAGFILSPDESSLLVYEEELHLASDSVSYYVFNRQRNRLEPLSEYGKQQMPVYSPNGKMIAFARNNDLYIKRLEFGTELRVTENGKPDMLANGVADRAYQQGFGITHSYVWSPDNRMIAYVQYDQTNVPLLQIGETTTNYPQTRAQSYAKPTFPITKASLFVYTIQYRKHLELKLPDQGDTYITALAWSSIPELLGVNYLNREQNERKTVFFNPLSGVSRVAYQEKTDTYISPLAACYLSFLPDNSFVMLSEKSGYAHLYHHATNGMLLRQLTTGSADITKVYGYDMQSKQLFFQSSTNGINNRGVYAVNLQGKVRVLFDKAGVNEVYLSPQFSHIVHQFSNVDTPPQFTLYDAKLRKIAILHQQIAVEEKLKEQFFPRKEVFSIQPTEEVTLSGWILKPADFDVNKSYPAVILVQEALNTWEISFAQDIASQGYVVFALTANGMPQAVASMANKSYACKGNREVADILLLIQSFDNLSFINKQSIAAIGIAQHAHTAIKLLQKTSSIKAVVAINPLTDFGNYIAVRSERWMGLPQKNFIGYQQAVLDSLPAKSGTLLLMHNADNDAISIQHTWRLVDSLVNSNHQFDMQLYPSMFYCDVIKSLHLHSFERIMSFLNKNL